MTFKNYSVKGDLGPVYGDISVLNIRTCTQISLYKGQGIDQFGRYASEIRGCGTIYVTASLLLLMCPHRVWECHSTSQVTC